MFNYLTCSLFILALLNSPAAKPADRAVNVVQTVGKRVALVVGMSKYQNIHALENPKNDARLIAKTLKDLGFELVGGGAQLDLNKPGFDRAVNAFGKQLAGADVAFFYYAGHGLQVRGANWLVPVDANPVNETDLDFQMVDVQLVLKQMEAAGTKLNLVVLDACRNNPFGGRGLRATSGGLAQMQAPEGTLISYATQPGNVAQDGAGADSPYTLALAETLNTPGMEVRNVFNQVGVKVKKATSGTQQPWLASSPIDGDFYFTGGQAGMPPQIASVGPSFVTLANVDPNTGPSSTIINDEERNFWTAINNMGKTEGYKLYLQQYPTGKYAELAKSKLGIVTSDKPQNDALAEKNAWDLAEKTQSLEAYNDFLNRFPTGRFAALAQSRIEKFKLDASVKPTANTFAQGLEHQSIIVGKVVEIISNGKQIIFEAEPDHMVLLQDVIYIEKDGRTLRYRVIVKAGKRVWANALDEGFPKTGDIVMASGGVQ